MRNRLVGPGVAAALVTTASSLAGGGSLELLDSSLATDVTIDSLGITRVLGADVTGFGPVTLYESFMGSAFFGTYIGDGFGQSISEEGTAVGGQAVFDEQRRAARWTQSGGWEDLGNLGATGSGSCQESLSYGISAGGETVVGLAWTDICSSRAFIWTSATGMDPLETVANTGHRASTISADGSTIAGFGTTSRKPAVWSASDGSLIFFDEELSGELLGITPDGGRAVGTVADETGKPAVYWNECDGVVPIGTLGGDASAEAYDISADGTVIVGGSGNVLIGFTSFVWTRHTGMICLQRLLSDNGVEIPDGVILDIATGVSADGSTVVGRAIDPSVKAPLPFRGFVATLPDLGADPCPADFDEDDQVGFTDLTQLLGVWGPCLCPPCPEDLDGDGQVGFTDLTALLGTWGPCLQK